MSPCDSMDGSTSGILPLTISHSLFRLMSIESLMPSNHFIPLLLLPSVFPRIRVFSNELAHPFRWPKYWSFSFSISPSNEYSGLISFRIDWFDLAVHRTPKSLLQHHSLKASILWCFISLLYDPTFTSIHDYWKNHSLDYASFVSKVKSLFFNTLCRFVIAFFPRSKHLLISQLQSPTTVILELKKINSLFPLFPLLFARKWWNWMPWSYFFECWVLSQLFHSPLSPSSRGSLVTLHFLPLKWYHLCIWVWSLVVT